jgi:hypothetical protein
MLERLMSAALVTAAACAVMFCGTPEPKAEATPTVAKATPVAAPAAIGTSKCDCSGPKDCVCDNCKCLACKIPKVEPVAIRSTPLKPVAATTSELNMGKTHVSVDAPLYTHPQPVAKPVTSPSHARHIAVTPRVQYVRQWRPNYGPLGRERGGQWVTVAVAPRQYQRQQPVYRYRSCANGSCR